MTGEKPCSLCRLREWIAGRIRRALERRAKPMRCELSATLPALRGRRLHTTVSGDFFSANMLCNAKFFAHMNPAPREGDALGIHFTVGEVRNSEGENHADQVDLPKNE